MPENNSTIVAAVLALKTAFGDKVPKKQEIEDLLDAVKFVDNSHRTGMINLAKIDPNDLKSIQDVSTSYNRHREDKYADDERFESPEGIRMDY